jgi:uncharacterized membrane protein YfcA
MPELSLFSVGVIFVALALGGVLKGATGAGVPVIAVPVMAAFFDVRLAVALMTIPNLASNTSQLWVYRADLLPGSFTWVFAGGGAAGVIVGTMLLARLPAEGLMLLVALAVTIYVGLRIAVPALRLDMARAHRLAVPAGFLAGLLQGAAGISAPASISFLNAIRMARPAFIATISAFFALMTVAQLPALAVAGLMTPAIAGLGVLSILPIAIFMPVGSWLARHMSARMFDILVLAFLSLLAVKLYYDALF